MTNPNADQLKAFIEKPFAFIQRIGIKAHCMEPHRIKLSLPLAGNENHIGSMYAGALFTLAEIPGGALYLTTFDIAQFYPVLKEMKIRFRRHAHSDVTVEANLSEDEARRIAAEAQRRGKAEFVLHTEVKDTQGQVVAEAEGVYQLRTFAPPPETGK